MTGGRVRKHKSIVIICGDCGAKNHAYDDDEAVQEDGSILGTVSHEEERESPDDRTAREQREENERIEREERDNDPFSLFD